MSTELDTAMDQRRKWHHDKGINTIYLSGLLATILFVAAWARYVDNGQVDQNVKILQNSKDIDEMKKNQREDTKNMSDKIDKIYEIVSREKK